MLKLSVLKYKILLDKNIENINNETINRSMTMHYWDRAWVDFDIYGYTNLYFGKNSRGDRDVIYQITD